VQVRRCKLGIQCHRHKWTPKADGLLGQMPDQAAAKRIGCSVYAVKGRRFQLGIPMFEPQWKYWTTKEDELLGTMPDAAVARNLGRGVSGVRSRRLQRGIPRWNSPAFRGRWLASEVRLLGTMPDKMVAEKCGRTERAVRMKRFFCASRHRSAARIPVHKPGLNYSLTKTSSNS
jgi:hypothetical protein